MQTIYLDISNKGVTPRIYAKQSDVGRKFVAVMTDGGVPFEIPKDALISIWYEGASGSGNYTDIGNESAISVSKNLISVELIHQMLAVPGYGEITIVVNSADGKQIGFWNIQYDVERVAGWGSESAKDYFSAFSNATENLVEASRLFLPDKTLTQKGRPAEAYEAGLRISALEGRVNELSSLPDGSTTGDAELADARVGYDGETYENVGEHIRDIGKLAHNTSFAAENLVGNIPILVSRQKDSDGGLARRYTTEMKLIGDAKYLDHIEVPVLIDRVGGYSGVHNSVVAVANRRISESEPIASQWLEIPDGESSATAIVNIGEWFLPEDTIIVSVLDASTSGILRYPSVSESIKVDWLEDCTGDVAFPDGYGSEYDNVLFVGTATFYDTIKNDAKTYISYDKQALTTAQQSQARENIGIVSDARYYPDLDQAIQDINEGHDEQVIAYGPSAKVKVFTAENGRLTVMLLDDVSESANIAINKDIDLVLNGKTLTFTTATARLTFGEGTECVINGEVAGSKIKMASVTGASNVYPVRANGEKLIVKGGTYESICSSAKASAIVFRHAKGHLVMDGCEVYAQNIGDTTTCTVMSDASVTVRNCKITAISENNEAYCLLPAAELTIYDSYIYARTNALEGNDVKSCGIEVSKKFATICKIYNSKIVADAIGDNAYEPCGVGISNFNVLFLKDTDCFGTHIGVSNHGKLYVSGGTNTGYSHGGFYFVHGTEGEAFAKDSVIRCGNYPDDGFFKDLYAVDGENNHEVLAGFYVATPSNEATTNGSTVYLDGCTIGYPGKTAFVLRGSSGEQNCTVNISNSTIVDGAGKIRVDNETHKLNVGIGTNITTDKITNPQWAEFTKLNYRRYNDEETVDGKDCAALQNQIEDRVATLEQSVKDISENALEIEKPVEFEWMSEDEYAYGSVGSVVGFRSENSDFNYSYIPVSPGEVYNIVGKHAWESFCWALTDKNSIILSMSEKVNGEAVTAIDAEITVPQGAAYLYFNKQSFKSLTKKTLKLVDTVDVLANKKIVYDGDSICYGAGYVGGYAKIIANMTHGKYDNQAHGGGILRSASALGDTRNSVVDNLVNLPTDGDLYCFDGGINDFWTKAVLGTYAPDNFTGELDVTTICGALETIFRYALNNFPGKPVCFVITHKIQNTAYRPNVMGNTFKEYRDAMVGICEKYSIPYYDAFSESGLNGWNETQSNLYLTGSSDGSPDGIHPNEEGYKRYYVPQLLALFRRIMPVE
jgi:lysophospholipase L1-like esterase